MTMSHMHLCSTSLFLKCSEKADSYVFLSQSSNVKRKLFSTNCLGSEFIEALILMKRTIIANVNMIQKISSKSFTFCTVVLLIKLF